jgi:hypothetical protein
MSQLSSLQASSNADILVHTHGRVGSEETKQGSEEAAVGNNCLSASTSLPLHCRFELDEPTDDTMNNTTTQRDNDITWQRVLAG